MKRRVLITGITGQDGSYLAEFLIKKGYEVHGIVRRVALENQVHRLWRIKKIIKKIHLHAGSMESYASIFKKGIFSSSSFISSRSKKREKTLYLKKCFLGLNLL